MTKRELRIKKRFGMRESGYAIFLFFPQELGYRCPKGHSNLTFSEFKEHIWCFTCKKDYHYAKDCVLIKDKFNPKNLPQQPRIITGITNFAKDGNNFNDIPKRLLKDEDSLRLYNLKSRWRRWLGQKSRGFDLVDSNFLGWLYLVQENHKIKITGADKTNIVSDYRQAINIATLPELQKLDCVNLDNK